MSAPPSPRLVHHPSPQRKRDRPPALDISHDNHRQVASDAEVTYHPFNHHKDIPIDVRNPVLSISITTTDTNSTEQDVSQSRPSSATSSLDPYYFGIQSPSDSPVPPLPTQPSGLNTTPDHNQTNEPVTPARNPAAIDRRGLVGVGELATPRWALSDKASDSEQMGQLPDTESYHPASPQEGDYDLPDSPWTIEAVDGESSGKEEISDAKPEPVRTLRSRPSVADESGGEEILYPRQPNGILANHPSKHHENAQLEEDTPKVLRPSLRQSVPEEELSKSPPSAFSSSSRRARKRTSDEFEMDQSGSLVSKRAGIASATKEKSKDDKSTTRKHRSYNAGSTNSSSLRDVKGKERRRESIGVSIGSGIKQPVKSPERHVRQASASSSSSTNADNVHSRRVHTSDFSRLPPSPSTSSIQQILKQTTTPAVSQTPPLANSTSKDNSHSLHSSPNVAHSLLRGTQEGWSGLDDEATAEALRKLDGLTGKTARTRASVGSFGRSSSASRPGTPASKTGGLQWEGVSVADGGKMKRGSGSVSGKERDYDHRQSMGSGMAFFGSQDVTESHFQQPDEQNCYPILPEKTPKKSNSTSARLSFTPKRGSTSSTTYASTPTTSSRDSASMSGGTSATSVSAVSGRHSLGKPRRNSASSDVSSIHSNDANHLKDRAALLASAGEISEDVDVPPVPPLPKDLSSYKSPPSTSTSLAFPTIANSEEKDNKQSSPNHADRETSLEVPSSMSNLSGSAYHRQSQHYPSTNLHAHSTIEQQPATLKTPSKKWSFSSALNLKIGSPSSQKTGFPLSPRAVTFGQQLRKSTSKDHSVSSASSKGPWSPKQPDAMASAGSLASLSSVGSVRTPALQPPQPKTPDRGIISSRPGTGSSASTNHASTLTATSNGPLSPTSSVRRGQSKRLTPSSIPFFRRSSSQSIQLPPSNAAAISTSPTLLTADATGSHRHAKESSSPRDYASLSTSVPGSAQKKSSMLSLGIPSLLKSSSRRSLQSDSKDGKESQKSKDSGRESEKEKAKSEKKKDDKDRSESRISVLISRKRGKTLSSTDPRKPKSPVTLPPMQISALEPATAQRVAKLKSSSISSGPSPIASRTTSSSSRLTSQTVSSMQKQSDTSLRSRNQLPTIAGSPSVGSASGPSYSHNLKDAKDPPSSLSHVVAALPKETPTKIPRISSRSSAIPSPPLKHSSSSLANRGASVNNLVSSSTNASPIGISTNEFGVMEGDEGTIPKSGAAIRHPSVRGSPSAPASRVPRQASVTAPSSGSILQRKSNRDSVSFIGLRKSSTSSVTSVPTPAAASTTESSSHHRFSALSPSRGLRLLGPKSSSNSRSSNAAGQNIHQTMGSPSSSRQSLSTPSPVPSTVDEEELLGDEEMLHYIKRQQAKKLAAGATQEELDELLKFPEPMRPNTPSSPSDVLRSSQAQYLSEYERKEILDYPSVYCIGAKSKKKLAVPDNSTNNYGYDDERGDYLIITNDHLAYRYEIMDTLGKGSFGQVLSCRDHCTGESVAIKIIRNKKRFHHQALVEIKILDNLRKWDADEKHHVIKMTEHFYFRNHLCIAMELLSINLYELIKANGFVGFTTALIRRFTSQMLMSLSLMRHHRIVHCDLKPENVLLKHPAKSAIKVIDFGSSCFEHEKIYTYIQSRFYRSPEVILGMNYHMAIDMWSLGCILAELYTGFPIFPGENEQEQLSCIMEVLGVPDKEFVNRSSRKKLFFDTNGAPRVVVNSKGRRRRPGTKTLAQVLRCNDEEFVDFISKCLVWDPERRIKPQAAMRHPFITAGRRPKAPQTTKSTPSSSSLGGSRKHITETPKKSLISAPTPLTARSSRTTINGVPTTPSTSHSSTLGSSSRSYRTSQPASLASYSSSRTLSSFPSGSK
ncbi:hypothetical protein BDQ17DRAFT_1281080 [Cyathus striatus]|nr:hypothetical protein BDQ17DRAFT_1281080 [Cyathus striatus]